MRNLLLSILALIPLTLAPVVVVAKEVSGMSYTYAVSDLLEGHSFGNEYCYVTLDAKSDVARDRSTPRYGIRESLNQKYYLLGWDVTVAATDGKPFLPVGTTFTPASQESKLDQDDRTIRKKFFLPFENNYRRSAHFLLELASKTDSELIIRSRALFPAGVRIEKAEYKGHTYLTIRYPEHGQAVIWGSDNLQSFMVQEVQTEREEYGDLGPAGGVTLRREGDLEVSVEFLWTPGAVGTQYALSFAYSLEETPGAHTTLLGALVDLFAPSPPGPRGHVDRVRELLSQSRAALDRYLQTTRLWTPDRLINRAFQWAKVNQLRLQQEGSRGVSFTNNPPSDIVVGRDTVWYVMGGAYYAPTWSRRLLEAWFRYGLEPSGKFVEYFTASREPIFKDDYGLNIADNTPLFLIASHHYFSLTGDQGFLQSVYPHLLNSANYIVSQRQVGENNRYGLVWCTSKDTFVRGLPVWRNAVPGYNLCGAPTELNAICYRALLLTAELATVLGDDANAEWLGHAATRLQGHIQTHLRSRTPANPFYYLHINPQGEAVDDLTGDLVFPVLCGVSDPEVSAGILGELFSERFWASTEDGAGGIRTVSSAQGGKWGYQAKAKPPGTDSNWNYGLLGGVWPNLGMWAARAAASQGRPDLSLKALRATFLLNEREKPRAYNVVPGEFNGYCNGDDLVQREMPLSPFLPGIFVWSSLESFLGITSHANALEVEPALPATWNWVAVSDMMYRGRPITILASRDDRTVYATVPVRTTWKQVLISASHQEEFDFEPRGHAFWLVVPTPQGHEILAGSAEATSGTLLDKRSGRVLAHISIPAGGMVRKGFETR